MAVGVAAAQQPISSSWTNAAAATQNEILLGFYPDEPVELTKEKAERGDAHAQWFLGGCYASGEKVKEDKSQAAIWYRKAAEQGHAFAQYDLGVCYVNGIGIYENDKAGAEWFLKAAQQGHGEAQLQLGMLLEVGKGVPQDYKLAYCWLSLAAAQDRKGAVEERDRVRLQMTSEQIAAAQELTRKFKPHQKSTAAIPNSTNNLSASGTGFFISGDGYLISNNHVVEGASQVRLVTSAGFISAKVVKVDAANDLALLKITNEEGRMKNAETFKPLPIAASRGVKLGGTVATVGFPNIGLQGFAPKLAKGEIASLSGAGDDARYFQISVPVQPGNSGGALVDERGNVVGVVSAKLNASAALALSGTLPENVNYAVKSSYLLSFLESVPDVASKLKEALVKEKKFEDVVKEAEQAAVLVLVY